MKKTSLKLLRASLPLTQKELATLSGLNERTITEIERRTRAVRLTTAFSVVNALNDVLTAKGRPTVTIFDLNWTLENAPDLEELSKSS